MLAIATIYASNGINTFGVIGFSFGVSRISFGVLQI